MGGLHQIPLLRTRGTPQERRGKECQSQREQRTPDQVPLNQLSKVHMNAQKRKQPAQSLHRSARVGPLHIQHSFQLSMYTTECVNKGSLCLGPARKAVSLLLGWLIQPRCNGFCFLLYSVVVFGCHLVEVCSFLMRSRKGVDPVGTGGTEELGGEDGETVSG